MRDISENVINNFGTSVLDIKLRPPSGAPNCGVALFVGRVSKHVSSIGKLSDSGNDPLELDSWRLWWQLFGPRSHSRSSSIEMKGRRKRGETAASVCGTSAARWGSGERRRDYRC